jgi:hypothetical protein
MLISDLRGATLQMHPNPAVLFGMARRVFEAGIGFGLAGGEQQSQAHKKYSQHNGGSTHPVIIIGTNPKCPIPRNCAN